MHLPSIYKALIPAVLYPHGGYHEQVERCREILEEAPNIAECFDKLSKAIAGKETWELEELYMRTFDMTPGTSLDLGWQLFGEDYNRGIFLVKMRERLRGFGIPETKELPDHLSHVLGVLAQMEREDAFDFATACVMPALKKAHLGVKEDNPYWWLLEGIERLLELQYGQTMEETNNG